MATSVGITVHVPRDLGFHRRRSVTIVLGAAVLDDVLGLLVLGLVTASTLGDSNTLELALLAVEAVIFVVGFGIAGPWIIARLGERLARLSPNAIFEVGIILMLALSLLANYIGLAAIIGAVWGARAKGKRIAREVGVGMVPRGAVGIVVAGIALAAGAVTEDVYAAVPGMVLATTIVGPYLVKAVFSGGRSAAPKADALIEPHSPAPETPAETAPSPAGDD